MADFDPFDPGVLADPYPSYATVRDREGLTRLPIFDAWLVARHDDVTAVLRQHRTYSSALGMGDLARMAFDDRSGGRRQRPRMLILEDPPVHTLLRRMVARGFTPTRITGSEGMVDAIARAHVEALVARGSEGDLVRDLAVPFPVRVIADLLGIPPSMFERFRAWSEAVVTTFSLTPDPAGAGAAMEEMSAFFADVVADRRRLPGDDLVSLLVQRGGEGEEPLSVPELVSFCFLLLIAGNETTTNLLGNALLVLFERPDLEARLRADPSLVPAFVEEVLRYDAPVQSLFRGLAEPATLAGVDLPEGARVMVLLGAANRDGRRYDRPDDVRLERFLHGTPDHVGFGSGIHLCLGAALARMEARVALTTLLSATRALRPTAPATRTASFLLRGCTSVPLEAVPA